MAKYTQDQINAMGAKGCAFRNPDGHYSYPIGDADDLDNAIRAVGRGGADHDAIRKYIIGRAKAMGKSSVIPGNWNADGSLGGSTSAPRTPFELLKRRRGSMTGKPERRGARLEMRTQPDGTGGTTFVFEGYGATFDDPFEMWDQWGDPYTEIVRPGAFTQSLSRPDLDVPFLIGHDDSGIALARTSNGTMQLAQDSRGMLVRAQMDGRRSDVRNLAYAVERGDQDEMSIGFITRGQEWSEDYETRSMLDLDVHRGDVSTVALAANRGTRGATMIPMPGEQAWGASWRPAAEELMLAGTAKRIPMIDAALCQAQKLLSSASGTDSPEFAQGMQLLGSAGIHVTHIIKNEGLPDPEKGQLAAGGPGLERRDDASGTILSNSDAPDYNPGAATTGGAALHPPMTGTHSHDHAAYGAAGHGSHAHQHVADSSHSHDHQYNADGTIVLDDSGVVEEVGGAMADADLLKRRLRLLELA